MTCAKLMDNILESSPERTGTCERDSSELSERKKQRSAEVNALRDTKLSGYFIYDGDMFDAHSEAVMSLLVASQDAATRLAVGERFYTEWTLYDNTRRTMTGEDFLWVVSALSAWRSAVHEYAVLLKECVCGFESLDALEEFDVTVGWPVSEEL